MKILYLPAYYKPEKFSSRYLNENIIEDLLNESKDNEVILYTPMPTRGINKRKKYKYKQIKNEIHYDGRLKIRRYKLFKESNNTIQRAVRYIIQGIKQIIKTIKIKNIDVIIMDSTPPTNGLIGGIIKKIHNCSFVYNLQDIFPASLVSTNIVSKKSLFYKIGRKIEKITYNNADMINVPSMDFKEYLIKKQVTSNKIKIISNWVDEKKVRPIEKEKNRIFNELNLDKNKFNVVYAGNIGKAQNIEEIIKIAKQLQKYKDIKFIIFGDGINKNYIKNMIVEENLKNVKLFPLQPYEKVSEVYSLADVSIVICKKGFGGVSIPSKTWTIMATKTPIIANFDKNTELQKIIEENKVGIFTEAGNTSELKEAIIKLYEDEKLLEEYGNNARNYIENNLTREHGTKQYIESIKNAIKRKEGK